MAKKTTAGAKAKSVKPRVPKADATNPPLGHLVLTMEEYETIVTRVGEDAVIILCEADIPDGLPDEIVAEMKKYLATGTPTALASNMSMFGDDGFQEFMAKMGKDDCNCPSCKRRRGETVEDDEDNYILGGGLADFLNRALQGKRSKNLSRKHANADIALFKQLFADMVFSRTKAGDQPPEEITISVSVVEADGTKREEKLSML